MRTRILIFDDDPLIRSILCRTLEQRGCEVFTFPDPSLCLLNAVPSCPCRPGSVCSDIIISDLNMPNIDGLSFVEQLKANQCRCDHIALISGDNIDKNMARAARIGCKLFAKPFRVSTVVDWITDIQKTLPPSRKLDNWHVIRDDAESDAR